MLSNNRFSYPLYRQKAVFLITFLSMLSVLSTKTAFASDLHGVWNFTIIPYETKESLPFLLYLRSMDGSNSQYEAKFFAFKNNRKGPLVLEGNAEAGFQELIFNMQNIHNGDIIGGRLLVRNNNLLDGSLGHRYQDGHVDMVLCQMIRSKNRFLRR